MSLLIICSAITGLWIFCAAWDEGEPIWKCCLAALAGPILALALIVIAIPFMAAGANGSVGQRAKTDRYAGRLRRGQPGAGRYGRSPGR